MYSQNCSYVVSGTLLEFGSEDPIGGAIISILNMEKNEMKQLISNQNGFFTFNGLCKGKYKLTMRSNDDSSFYDLVIKEQILSLILHLKRSASKLEEVVVRTSAIKYSGARSKLSTQQLSETSGQSLANALSNLSGVSTLQTGSTIAKPVIHGLHSNRVVILNNGVKLEGQQWGSDHAPEVDAFAAQNLSVSKGASNLIYGGDAIGGVVIADPNPLPKDRKTHAEFNTVYFSNNHLFGAAALVEQNLVRFPDFSWRVQASYKQGGNAQTPLYYTANTGIVEWNLSAYLGLRKPNYNNEIFINNYHNKLGIFVGSNYGSLDDLLNAIKSPVPINNFDSFYYSINRPYQDVNHFTFKFKNFFKLKNKLELNANVSYQNNHRQEYDYAVITDLPELDLTLQTIQTDVYFEKKSRFNQIYGVSNQIQLNTWTGARFFIPKYNLINTGAFAIFKKPLVNRQKIEFGLRFDYKSLVTSRNNTKGVYQQFLTFANFSGSFLYEKAFSNFNKLNVNTSLAWRPPNVNELFVYGLHQGTASFEIGDSNLKSEKGFNNILEWQYGFNNQKDQLEISIYANILVDFINVTPLTYPITLISGTFPAFKYYQTNALFTGLDFTLNKTLYKNLSTLINASFLFARDLKINDWLPQIPPQNIGIGFNYAFKTKKNTASKYIKLGFKYVFQQNQVPKNYYDFAPPPKGYLLANLDFGWGFSKRFSLGAGINNLLNIQYRDYLNRFRYFTDAPGINLSVRLKYNF
ncbi:MAG: TonB-dependent receptor [Alphaproteobacteria bacterium]|nr:TonB-dependent receptor [Alphaproteobacteria bacterium]